MRQVTRKGLITMAAAGGVLALGGGYAHADAGAAGAASSSPGVLSGNSIQVPIDVPVNVCGNSVDVGGLLNPTSGNDCGNGSSDSGHAYTSDEGSSSGHGSGSRASGHEEARDSGAGTGRHRASGTSAQAVTKGSPGILSGNQVQAPVEIPLNVCGNSVTVGGLLNPVFGNTCENDTETVPPPVVPQTPHTPEKPVTPHAPPAPEPQLVVGEQLAHTGAGGLDLLVPASAGLLLAGAGTVLYRRSRSAA
ncbi:chaplin [Streptomyces sp. ME02-6979-3A]|uniref:chaplin n=1 Tax=Streptomyces sp. ME02-6979-3A TaxID=3028673 RepID=UPI0029A08ADB|nr:chaplin [Streptomyces sp. ME02-6979-3A]MDX3327305.1 chaplin [Streptomyces sp. ME02-6979-3A]MDX3327312.1 chaplin [Streptomyces sp. ME02-6979-3A]